MKLEFGVQYAGTTDVDTWGHRWEATQAMQPGDTLMAREPGQDWREWIWE